MNQLLQARCDTRNEYRENWTAGWFVVALLIVPAFVAVLAAPALVLGMVLGAVALRLGEQIVQQLKQNSSVVTRKPARKERAARVR